MIWYGTRTRTGTTYPRVLYYSYHAYAYGSTAVEARAKTRTSSDWATGVRRRTAQDEARQQAWRDLTWSLTK